jgi:hypothetical protein
MGAATADTRSADTVPHLAFYATPDDVASIMDAVLGECRVFESYSVPDESLREFSSVSDIRDALVSYERQGFGLMLYAPSMKGAFVIERIHLKPGAIKGKSWREKISGWGLIQVAFGGVRGATLKPSLTNHNSERRARAWSNTVPALPPVDDWDFKEVTRISRRINRHIAGQAVRKQGARHVLHGADRLVAAGPVILGS